MNRVLFKQLFQAEAIDYCQLDWARLASLNEIIAVYLMAQKFGVPVCPHAGGVGLCELVQHLSVFDFMAVSDRSRTGSLSTRPPSRALRRSVPRRQRSLPAADAARLRRRDDGGDDRDLRVSRWHLLGVVGAESTDGSASRSTALISAGCAAAYSSTPSR